MLDLTLGGASLAGGRYFSCGPSHGCRGTAGALVNLDVFEGDLTRSAFLEVVVGRSIEGFSAVLLFKIDTGTRTLLVLPLAPVPVRTPAATATDIVIEGFSFRTGLIAAAALPPAAAPPAATEVATTFLTLLKLLLAFLSAAIFYKSYL